MTHSVSQNIFFIQKLALVINKPDHSVNIDTSVCKHPHSTENVFLNFFTLLLHSLILAGLKYKSNSSA